MYTLDLAGLREQIDGIDKELIELMGRRFQVTADVGRLKSREVLAAVDPEREAAQTERYSTLALENNVDPAVVAAVFRVIVDAVVRDHRAI